jgi:hypothetical protein
MRSLLQAEAYSVVDLVLPTEGVVHIEEVGMAEDA